MIQISKFHWSFNQSNKNSIISEIKRTALKRDINLWSTKTLKLTFNTLEIEVKLWIKFIWLFCSERYSVSNVPMLVKKQENIFSIFSTVISEAFVCIKPDGVFYDVDDHNKLYRCRNNVPEIIKSLTCKNGSYNDPNLKHNACD